MKALFPSCSDEEDLQRFPPPLIPLSFLPSFLPSSRTQSALPTRPKERRENRVHHRSHRPCLLALLLLFSIPCLMEGEEEEEGRTMGLCAPPPPSLGRPQLHAPSILLLLLLLLPCRGRLVPPLPTSRLGFREKGRRRAAHSILFVVSFFSAESPVDFRRNKVV